MMPALFTRMCKGLPEATNCSANASMVAGARRSSTSISTRSASPHLSACARYITGRNNHSRTRVYKNPNRLKT